MKLESASFKNDSIIKTLNEKFYFIDLNAEEKREIIFGGHIFKYKPSGPSTGIHELAEQLATLNGKVAYPTICILNSDNEIVFQYDQFINVKDLLTILTRLK